MMTYVSARQELKSSKVAPSTLVENGRNRLIPALLTIIVVLPTVTEAKFRQRSALEALAGSIDFQILFELAVWTLGIGYVFISLRREISELRPPNSAGGKYVATLAVLVLLGTAWATPSALTATRGLQTALILVAVLSVTPLTRRTMSELISRCATWFSIVVAGLFALTVALPTTSLFTDLSYFGIRRLKLLEIHPIPTANLLVLTIVVNTWVLLSGDFSNSRMSQRTRILWIILLVTGLLLTRSRGALVGCVVATLVLAVAVLGSTEKRRLKLILRFSALGLGALTILFWGSLIDFMLRGESVQSVLTLNNRTYLLETMINLWQQEFWFGFGHLSGRSALLDKFAWAGQSHGLVGEAMLSYGLIGLMLVSIGLLGVMIRASKLMRRSRLGPLFLALIAVVGSQALISDSFLGAPSYELTAFILLIIVGWEGAEPVGKAVDFGVTIP